MNRPSAIARLLLAAGAALPLYGCTAPHPAIMDGDANSVQISYGGDVSSTLPLARKHCAQFEKVPRLADRGFDLAIYDCVRR